MALIKNTMRPYSSTDLGGGTFDVSILTLGDGGIRS